MSEETLQMLFSYAPIILVGLVFYFMLYRPQKKQEKTRHEMLDNLKKGDKVVTIGGAYGTITAITKDKVTLKVPEKVEIEFARTSIASKPNGSTGNVEKN